MALWSPTLEDSLCVGDWNFGDAGSIVFNSAQVESIHSQKTGLPTAAATNGSTRPAHNTTHATFDGFDELEVSNLSTNVTLRTYVAVLKATSGYRSSTYGAAGIVGTANSSGGFEFSLLNTGSGNGKLRVLCQGVVELGVNTAQYIEDNTLYVVVAWYNQSTGAWGFRVNGEAGTTGTTNTTFSSPRNARIGNSFSSDCFWYGDMYSVTAYDDVYDTSELQLREAAAAWRATGDGSLLPTGHPYKTEAPLGTYKVLADTYGVDLLDTWSADTGIRLNGSNVQTWNSKVGLKSTLSWGGGTQPIEDVSGKPSVYFKQYGALALSNPTGYPTGSMGTTTIMVVRSYANNAYDTLFRYVGNHFGTMGSGSGWAYNPGYGDTRNSGVNPNTSGFDIVVISVADGTNPAIKIRINGTLAYSGTVGTRSLSLSSDNIRMGVNSAASSLPANWTQWFQVGVVDRGSTDAEMEEAEGIVAWKWGLEGLLPSGHTYKTEAPLSDGSGPVEHDPFGANLGTFSLTGQATGIKTARKLTAAYGAMTLTGQTVNVKASRKLASANASYVLSGQAATFQLTIPTPDVVRNDPLGWNMLGATDEDRGNIIDTTYGNFILSGQAVGLITSHRLLANQGTFSIAGQIALIKKALNLLSAKADFILSGQNARLLSTRRLSAAQGSFAYTGQSAIIFKSSPFPTAAGFFTITGQAATFKRAYALKVTTGAFILGGQSALFYRSGRQLQAVTGIFGLNGQTIQITQSKRLVAAPAVFTISGKITGLTRQLLLRAQAGIFTLRGQVPYAEVQNSKFILSSTEAVATTIPLAMVYNSRLAITSTSNVGSQLVAVIHNSTIKTYSTGPQVIGPGVQLPVMAGIPGYSTDKRIYDVPRKLRMYDVLKKHRDRRPKSF